MAPNLGQLLNPEKPHALAYYSKNNPSSPRVEPEIWGDLKEALMGLLRGLILCPLKTIIISIYAQLMKFPPLEGLPDANFTVLQL